MLHTHRDGIAGSDARAARGWAEGQDCPLPGLGEPVVAVPGTVGRTVVLTLSSARGACRCVRAPVIGPGPACVGLTFGVVFLAAATPTGRDGFGPSLVDLVHSTAGPDWVSPLIRAMGALIPAQVEPYVTEYLIGYSVAVDAALLLLVAAIGVVSLTLRALEWSSGGADQHRVQQPSLIAAGLTVSSWPLGRHAPGRPPRFPPASRQYSKQARAQVNGTAGAGAAGLTARRPRAGPECQLRRLAGLRIGDRLELDPRDLQPR